MSVKKDIPINYKKDYYNRWLFAFECINLHRKTLANYWSSQAGGIKQAQDECLNGADLKPVSDFLYQRAYEHYHYYMTCSDKEIAQESGISLDFNNVGCSSGTCQTCQGRGYIQDRQCICRHCRGYGYNIGWVFKKKESLYPGLTIIFTNKLGNILDYKEIGQTLFSVL